MNYKDYKYYSGNWTMTDNQYKFLIDLLEDNRPNRIIEFGGGQSTRIFQKYKSKYNCQFFSIEHNSEYACENTILFNLVEKTNINIGKEFYSNINKYDGLENWLSNQDKFDFVLIDGPFGFGFRENYDYGRVQLLSFVALDKLSDNAIILVHDTERINMQKTLNEFEMLLIRNTFNFNKQIINDIPQLAIFKINKHK